MPLYLGNVQWRLITPGAPASGQGTTRDMKLAISLPALSPLVRLGSQPLLK